MLVTASLFVNGRSVAEVDCDDVDTLTYYHIELEDHDVVLANGVAAETLQANENRKRFDNYAEYVALYGTTTACMTPYAPVYRSRGGRDQLLSHWRSFVAPIWDCRTPAECIRDGIAASADRLAAPAEPERRVGERNQPLHKDTA